MTKTAASTMAIDQRALRAKAFAAQIMQQIVPFIPDDRVVLNQISDHLAKTAYDANAMIVSVPPEYDQLVQAEIERRMVTAMMATVVPPVSE